MRVPKALGYALHKFEKATVYLSKADEIEYSRLPDFSCVDGLRLYKAWFDVFRTATLALISYNNR